MVLPFNGEVVIQKSLEALGDTGAAVVAVSSAISLADLFGGSLPTDTRFVLLTASDDIRYTSNGRTPTGSFGHLVTVEQMPYWFDVLYLGSQVKIIGAAGNVDVYAEAFY